ncbi:MAG: sulfotransferase [Bacteroidales bacterium]
MSSDRITHSGNFRKMPLWFRMLNSSWKTSYFLGTKIKLRKDDLIKAARKVTGLNDLGKDFSDEPLEKLLQSVNEEAALHPVGRFITRQRFVSLLSIRLRAEYFFRKYPEILEQPLYPAWIIVGLQRTGTTKLQRLLATDPDHRVIPSWEVINPVPLNLDEKTRDKRIDVAKLSVKAVKLMSPGFFAIHPIDVYEPEEDILLLDISFMSTTPEAMMNVPSYASWLEKTDQSSAYAYAVKLLKFLQWQQPAKRWVLKTPHHLEFSDLIEKHFGEVHFLWPHRRVYESVPSFLSMVTYNHMMFSDQVDVKRIADHWVRKTGYMLDKALDYRLKDDNTSKFTDIWYDDMVRNSEKELSRIYSLDGGLTPELIQRFNKHEKEHPHRKYGSHQYSLADFGLKEDDIDHFTTRYQEFISKHYDR